MGRIVRRLPLLADRHTVNMHRSHIGEHVRANKNYQKENYRDDSALNYFLRGRGNYLMHPEAEELLERLLRMLAEKGERATEEYIRREVLHNKKEKKKRG